MTHGSSSPFASSYFAARGLFLGAAAEADAEVVSYRNDRALGPSDRALFCDVATVGPADAPRRLLVLSATHGVEGFAGSAAQVSWLRQNAARNLPEGVGVVFVHAINPWGFAHRSRTTENNVDLNRNFIDHADGPPGNPGYADLHQALCPKTWDEDSIAAADRAIESYKQQKGEGALNDVMIRGQYSHPTGIMYGGCSREWSNLTLQTIVDRHLAGAKRVGLIDWHTGHGPYGAEFFLCFNTPGSEERRQAVRWWGIDDGAVMKEFAEGRLPKYTGLVFQGVVQFLRGTPVAGAVVELGTRPIPEMIKATRLDRWLKFEGSNSASRSASVAAMMEAFAPSDPEWRQSVVTRSDIVHDAAIRGLAGWA